jgi:ABC-type transporter Mla subunit MlaD
MSFLDALNAFADALNAFVDALNAFADTLNAFLERTQCVARTHSMRSSQALNAFG